MLALVLVGALLAQSAIGAPPTNCAEFCDEQPQQIGNQGYHQSKSSYSSYAKSSYNSRSNRLSSGASGLGNTGGRLETFDENVIGVPNLERPGTWNDEKSYVTDDGKGKIDYRAGQQIFNNGYSKFAQHSYSYNSRPGSHAPLSNSQVISSLDFDSQLQNIRTQISKFMGDFTLGSGFTVDQNTLDNFKVQAGAINNYMDSVCNSMDAGSAGYEQVRQIMDNFRRQSEQMQRQMESVIVQSSSSITSQSHGVSYYPRPSTPEYVAPARVIATTPRIDIEEQRINQECSQLRNEIDVFYNTFNRANYETFSHEESLNKFREDAEKQIALINQKLTNLRFESTQHESMRQDINQMVAQFESYSADIKRRMEDVQIRIRLEQQRLREEIERQEKENLRRLEAERIQKEQELAEKRNELKIQQQKLQEAQAKVESEIRLEEIRLAQIKKQEEDLRIQREKENLRLRQEETLRAQREQERIRLQQAEHLRISENLRQQQAENLRIQENLLQQQRAEQLRSQQQQQQITQTVPQVSGSVTGSVSHQYQYQSQTHLSGGNNGAVSGSLIHQQPQQTHIRPHVDMTAMLSRLQQDYNRLQSEVNSINTFTMRLTANNAQSVTAEAENHVQQLRQNIDNLCEQSSRYQNNNLKKMAEDLKVRLESLFRSFENQAAEFTSQASSAHQISGGYESGSSWSSSAKYGQVKAPAITNVEYTHSKSTDVEIQHRPASSQRYRNQHQQVDCVESYSGQPCVQDITRNKRQVGDSHGSLPENTQQRLPLQLPIHDPTRDLQIDPQFYPRQIDPLMDPQSYPRQIDPGFDLSHYRTLGNDNMRFDINPPTTRPVQVPQQQEKFKSEIFDAIGQSRQRGRSFYLLDITKPGAMEEFMAAQTLRNRINRPINIEKDSEEFQQHVNYGQNEDLDSLQKPRSQKSDFELRRTQSPRSTNSEVEDLNKSDVLQKSFDDKQENVREDQQFEDSLEKSGFYDNPRRNEERQPEITSANDREQFLITPEDKPQNVIPIEDMTLEKSGFNDYPEQNKRFEVTENSHRFQQLTTVRPRENFDLEKSGFYDSSEFNKNSQTDGFNQQQHENQGVFNNERRRNDETFDNSDFTQQTAGEIDFGSNSQLSRQASSRARNRNEHPVGQYMDNLNVPKNNEEFHNTNQESLSTVRPLIKPAPKPVPRYTRPWQVSQIENVPKQTENNLEKQFENENINTDNVETQKMPNRGDIPGYSEPTSTSTSTTTTAVPPVVFTTSVPPIVMYTTSEPIIEKPNCNDCQSTLGINGNNQWWMNRSENNQLSQTNRFNQQNYRFSQQSNFRSQHSFRTASGTEIQNPSNEYNFGSGLDDQTQKIQFNQPSDQGSIFKYREQETNKFKLEHQGFENLDSNQRHLFNINQEPSLTQQSRNLNSNYEPLLTQQSGILNSNYEPLLTQQSGILNSNYEPLLTQQSRNLNINHESSLNQQSTIDFNDQSEGGIVIEQGSSQTTADDFAQSVIPLDTLKPMDESNTTPRTFWKRIGQKLSNSFDKAKERARTIFG